MSDSEILKRRALRLSQSPDCHVFLLSLSPADLAAVASITFDEKQSSADVPELKQPAVRERVAEIQSSLKESSVMLTPVVLAFSPEVKFRGSRGPDVSDGLGSAGTLDIPLRTRAGRKPAWVLDGQHRLLAFAESQDSEFAIPVCALISDDPGVLRDQFRRIHNTQPLPEGFLDAMFPSGTVAISRRITPQELPDAVCDWLASDPESPFQGKIAPRDAKKSASAEFIVSRAALAETISDSLSSPYGALFPYRNLATSETDINGLCNALATYWSGVKAAFPDAWGKSPKKSRLLDRVGIRAMGRLMNRVLPVVDLSADDRVAQVARQLQKIQPVCRWTSGVWEELDGFRWNELPNTTRHVNLLANFLIRAYVTK